MSNMKNLKKHMKVQHESQAAGAFVCAECGIDCLRKEKLLVHVAWEHMPADCSKCGKKFTSGKKCAAHRKNCLRKNGEQNNSELMA